MVFEESESQGFCFGITGFPALCVGLLGQLQQNTTDKIPQNTTKGGFTYRN